MGSQLPRPDPAFKGKIGETYKDSTPELPAASEGTRRAARTCCSILLDDVGFGMCSTFGGPVPTPHMDKLASNGLKYTRFHTTALCSPTRAALLAGRNHHSCRHGRHHRDGHRLSRLHRNHPAEHAPWSRRRLRDNGYATGDVRQVAQHAGARHQPGRSVRPLADRPRVRLLLRLQPGRNQPVLPDALSEYHAGCRSRKRPNRATTSPRT